MGSQLWNFGRNGIAAAVMGVRCEGSAVVGRRVHGSGAKVQVVDGTNQVSVQWRWQVRCGT